MDPYLEGYLWPDVHQRLAAVICELLAPQISPAYVARMSLYTVADTSPEEDVGILYPDVEVLRRKAEEPAEEYTTASSKPVTPATITIPATQTVEVRIPVVEIRDRKHNQLITAIEIISPVNKRKPGLQPYIENRERLHQSGVHLLEIDLIRRGQRPFCTLTCRSHITSSPSCAQGRAAPMCGLSMFRIHCQLCPSPSRPPTRTPCWIWAKRWP